MYDAAVIVLVAAGGQHVVVTAILIDDLVLLAECSREHEWEGTRTFMHFREVVPTTPPEMPTGGDLISNGPMRAPVLRLIAWAASSSGGA